jgi:hypothetical protein
MLDFVHKQQYEFLNRDNTRISWWLNVKYVIRVKTLYWTYASLKMIHNELKHVKDMKECVTLSKWIWFVFNTHHNYILSSNGELFLLCINPLTPNDL